MRKRQRGGRISIGGRRGGGENEEKDDDGNLERKRGRIHLWKFECKRAGKGE
jgi:hypothetical protein